MLCAAATAAAEVEVRTANNGNLVMEDVPEIPAAVVDGLNRYQNVRSAYFEGWQEDGSGIYISTRFADVDQLHRVDTPGGARHQRSGHPRRPDGGGVRRRSVWTQSEHRPVQHERHAVILAFV